MRPRSLTGIDVPGLHFADVVGARVERRPAALRARKALTWRVLHRYAGERAAQIVVGRNIDHPRLRAEGGGRPVLAAVGRRAELGALARARLARGIDIRPAGH